MTDDDPLAEFEGGVSPTTEKRIFAVKMAQSILAERDMYDHNSIALDDVLTLSEYLLNGKATNKEEK